MATEASGQGLEISLQETHFQAFPLSAAVVLGQFELAIFYAINQIYSADEQLLGVIEQDNALSSEFNQVRTTLNPMMSYDA